MRLKTSKELNISLAFLAIAVLLYCAQVLSVSLNLFSIKVWVLFTTVVTIYYAKQKVRWVHSFMLFIASFLLFTYSRLFLDILGLTDLSTASLYKYYIIKDKTLVKSLLILNVSYLSVFTSFFYSRNNQFVRNKLVEIPKISNIVLLVFLLVLPGTLLKLRHDFIFVLANSYTEMYNSFTSAPVLYRMSWYFSILLIPILLVDTGKKKFTFLVLFVYVILGVIDSFKGSRGALVKPLFFCLWYYYKFYNTKDISIYKILAYGVFFVFIMQLYLVYRSRIDLDLETIKLVAPLFFSQQGVSFTLLPLYFDFSDAILNPSDFYILYPFTSTFQRLFTEFGRDGHSFGFMEGTLSLDHKIMYAINPDAYLDGYGIGSNYVLELFVLGGIVGVIAGSFILGYCINKFENIVLYNRSFIVISIVWIENLTWMSRGSYLPELTKLIFPILTLFALNILLRKR